ncbi:hypothetical protein VSR68_10325 [Paraburkholderia phymatum]
MVFIEFSLVKKEDEPEIFTRFRFNVEDRAMCAIVGCLARSRVTRRE